MRRGNRGTAAALIGFLGLGLLSGGAHAQTTWHVDDSAAPGGDGLSWATAMNSLQSALDVVSNADQIWVAEGTYYPTNLADPLDSRSARFWLHDPFQLYGGFDGTETSLSERDPALFDDTILSGDIGVLNDPSDNAYHVVEVTSGFSIGTALARLDGFLVTAGNSSNFGGGVLVAGPGSGGFPPKLLMVDCTLNSNSAARGGGLAVRNFGQAYLKRCTVSQNIASNQGAGIYSGNVGILRAVNTRFNNNKTANVGGAVYVESAGPAVTAYANCIFNNNKARLGGAVFLKDGRVFGGGTTFGGMGSWFNCTFVANEATEIGGACYAVTTTAAPADAEIYNSIVWGNTAPSDPSILGTGLDVQYSDIEGGYTGMGNIDVDPLFITLDRQGAGSPVNDAGSNSLLVNDFGDIDDDSDSGEELPLDFLNSTRRLDDPTVTDTGSGTAPIVDMGAHEVNVYHGGG